MHINNNPACPISNNIKILLYELLFTIAMPLTKKFIKVPLLESSYTKV